MDALCIYEEFMKINFAVKLIFSLDLCVKYMYPFFIK